MKKQLLIVVLATLSITVFGQKIWNFGGDATTWPVSAGVGTGPYPVVIDGLSITGITTNVNMGQVEANVKTFTSPTTSTNYSFANRFKFNGAGYSGAAATDVTPLVNMPTQRYLTFNVTGNSQIYAIGQTGSNSSARKIFITDGTTLIGAMDFPASTVLNEASISYTGSATTLYVFCNSSVNLYYMTATNVATTGLPPVNANKTIKSTEYFDATGKQLPQTAKGLVLKKITYDDGTSASEKVYIKEK